MARLRTAILGCGGRGRAHAAGYAASPRAEIVGCADPALENARALAAKHAGAKVYMDYRELLNEQHPDVVSICTWPEPTSRAVTWRGSVVAAHLAVHQGMDLSGLVKDETSAWSLSQVLCHQVSGTPLAKLVRPGTPATDPGASAP